MYLDNPFRKKIQAANLTAFSIGGLFLCHFLIIIKRIEGFFSKICNMSPLQLGTKELEVYLVMKNKKLTICLQVIMKGELNFMARRSGKN